MSEFSWLFQVGLFDALKNQTDCGDRVFEDVPENAAFPYVYFSEVSSKRRDASFVAHTVEQITLTIVTSGNKKKSNALKISAKISDLLVGKRFLVDGFQVDYLIVAEYGRKDVEREVYQQFMRIEAHFTKEKEN